MSINQVLILTHYYQSLLLVVNHVLNGRCLYYVLQLEAPRYCEMSSLLDIL